jgi:hypothetical protein
LAAPVMTATCPSSPYRTLIGHPPRLASRLRPGRLPRP